MEPLPDAPDYPTCYHGTLWGLCIICLQRHIDALDVYSATLRTLLSMQRDSEDAKIRELKDLADEFVPCFDADEGSDKCKLDTCFYCRASDILEEDH